MPKDMNLRDILSKPVIIPQKVCEFRGGSWSFISLSNPVKVVEGVEYFYMSNKFGIAAPNQTNPSKTLERSLAGNYIAFDSLNSTVAIVSTEEFNRLFPQPNKNPPNEVTTSEALRDKNKITEVYENSRPRIYNNLS